MTNIIFYEMVSKIHVFISYKDYSEIKLINFDVLMHALIIDSLI
jgi:hypothetical protein